MRKFCILAIVLVVCLSFAMPAYSAAPEGHGNIKLRVFVHYPKDGRPAPAPGVCDPTSSDPATYGLTGWKLGGPRTYRVNYATCPQGMAAQAVIEDSFDTWTAASGIVFTEGATTNVTRYKYDGQNIVIWGRVPSGAIAVTYTWYSGGIVLENDTIMGSSLPWAYNSVSDPDKTCGNLYAYDVQNILTHELGHWLGMDDLYKATDHDLTMYGYGSKGELKKDTLAMGDEDGIIALYK